MAYTHEELQALCDALQEFCQNVSMKVNVGKTEMSVFQQRIRGGSSQEVEGVGVVFYAGVPLVRSPVFKYLGILFHETDWISRAPKQMADKASKAMWALIHKIHVMGISCPDVQVKLFNSMVASVGNYGSQVWGVRFLRVDSEAHVFSNPFQNVVLEFARNLAGVRSTVSRWVLLCDLGFLPCQCVWEIGRASCRERV